MNERGLARRPRPLIEELTSRRNSTEIPGLLDLMEAVFDPVLDKQREADRRAGKKLETQRPLDVLLSTNMISVGVDVGRLGLMLVAGQPKSTAEYIQATSRVGRRHPGLVCTVYNWARPRDLSHYERFGHYHATFYEQVEPLSVTPFSARALDRGITALLVSLTRLRSERLSTNEGASQLQVSDVAAQKAIEEVRARVAKVSGSQSLGDEVADRLRRVLDEWANTARRKPALTYKKVRGDSPWLLLKPEEQDWETFTCLNSLRDVEPSPGLILQEDATKGGA
jgi:superfamily II DNA or RNA helicase